ncbi:MAG: hypothetical protein WCI71_14890 [Bacteroidota bacterium]
MKWTLLLIAISICILPCHAQKVISGKSELTRIYIKPEYKRGLPPILFADLNFNDENNNGILEANEKAWITLNITNKGKGTAQNLAVIITDNISDPGFVIGKATTIPHISIILPLRKLNECVIIGKCQSLRLIYPVI